MRHLKSILIAVLASLVLIVGIGLLLDKEYKVERKIFIQAKPDSVFQYVKDLTTWPEWTVWNKENEPALNIRFERNESRAVKMKWEGENLDKGELTITKIEDNQAINFSLVLEESFQSNGRISVEKHNSSGTDVKWVVEGDVGNNIVQRFFILLADNFIGPDLEESLKGLKKISEGEKE